MRFVSAAGLSEKAKKLAAEYLANSTYKDSLASVRQFFTELGKRSSHLSQLLSANLGDSILAQMMYSDSDSKTTEKDDARLNGALPLRSRTRIDPWTDHIEIVKTVEGGSSSKDYMPFEVTPFFPYLMRRPKTTAARLDAPVGKYEITGN